MDNAEALRALERMAKRIDAIDGALDWKCDIETIRAHLTAPGYVRVPVEPTDEMIRKGQGQWSGESMVEIYKAMLAAAAGESHE